MKNDLQLKVINSIRELRFDNNLSQAALSDILDISYGLIGNIESTRYEHKYTLKQLKILSEHFEFKLEELFLTPEELKKSKKEAINLLITKIIEYNE